MKTKSKFNIIDTFVILIILALIAGTVLFALYRGGIILSGKEKKQITYTVCIYGIEEDLISSFAKGNDILNSSTFKSVGKIVKTDYKKHMITENTAYKGENDGEFVLGRTESSGLYDVYITITGTSDIDERGIAYIDSQKIITGASVYVRSGNYAAQGFITDFSIG
jgi:hypothetical protein